MKIHFLGLALNNKFLPVHCVVARDECPQRVLQDGFVIIPAHTKFHEIVAVVLHSMEADVGKIDQDERINGKKQDEKSLSREDFSRHKASDLLESVRRPNEQNL